MKKTLKIKIEDIYKNEVKDKIIPHFKKNKTMAFTRYGLLVELWDCKEKELNKSWGNWEKEYRSKYDKVVRELNKLVKTKYLIKVKKGKQFFYHYNSFDDFGGIKNEQ